MFASAQSLVQATITLHNQLMFRYLLHNNNVQVATSQATIVFNVHEWRGMFAFMCIWVGKTFLASFHVVQRRVVENVQFRSSTNTTFFSLVVAEATTIQWRGWTPNENLSPVYGERFCSFCVQLLHVEVACEGRAQRETPNYLCSYMCYKATLHGRR